MSCVDEEYSIVDCVSRMFRTATLRTYNYNYIDKYVLMCVSMLLLKDVVALQVTVEGKGGILIRSLFTGLICNNKLNVTIM